MYGSGCCTWLPYTLLIYHCDPTCLSCIYELTLSLIVHLCFCLLSLSIIHLLLFTTNAFNLQVFFSKFKHFWVIRFSSQCYNDRKLRNISLINSSKPIDVYQYFQIKYYQQIRLTHVLYLLVNQCNKCHPNAYCENSKCVCNNGYVGDGTYCDGK